MAEKRNSRIRRTAGRIARQEISETKEVAGLTGGMLKAFFTLFNPPARREPAPEHQDGDNAALPETERLPERNKQNKENTLET